jgi:MFS family permease
MFIFLPVAIGQIVSVTGTALTGFALGAWVYQETRSTTQYAFILLCAMLPALVFAPLAGALVDRWDRRRIMILADSGAAVCTALLALLIYLGRLQIWHIYLILMASSILRGFQTPAYFASISLLVPKEQLGRANGILQFETTSRYLLSPVMAGWLMDRIGVPGVMAIDFATFIIAVSIVLAVRFPEPKRSETSVRRSLLREAAYGWQYISAKPGFLGLMLLFALGNYANLMTDTVLPPMLLDFTSPSIWEACSRLEGLGCWPAPW